MLVKKSRKFNLEGRSDIGEEKGYFVYRWEEKVVAGKKKYLVI